MIYSINWVNTFIILKLSYEIHLMNAEFNLIRKQLWTILFVSNLQWEFIFGSYELVEAKRLALYSGMSGDSGQPCLQYHKYVHLTSIQYVFS